MTLTVCDKDCDLLAGLKANFIITTVLSTGLMNRAEKKKKKDESAAHACFLLAVCDFRRRHAASHLHYEFIYDH